MPFSPLTNSILVAMTMYLILVGLAAVTNELSIVRSDVLVPIALFIVGYLIDTETYISNHIKKTAPGIAVAFKYDVRKRVKGIVNNKLRITVGLIALVPGWFIIYDLVHSVLRYTSVVTQSYITVAAMLIPFILGEVVTGVILVIHEVTMIGRDLSGEINVSNPRQLAALKLLGGWCLKVAVFGAVISAVTFPAVLLAPWQSGIPQEIFLVWLMALAADAVLLLLLFVVPLRSIHRALAVSKTQKLTTVLEQHELIYGKLTEVLQKKNLTDAGTELEVLNTTLNSIRATKDMIERIPEWPWDMKMIRTLIIALLAPLLSSVILPNLGRVIGSLFGT